MRAGLEASNLQRERQVGGVDGLKCLRSKRCGRREQERTRDHHDAILLRVALVGHSQFVGANVVDVAAGLALFEVHLRFDRRQRDVQFVVHHQGNARVQQHDPRPLLKDHPTSRQQRRTSERRLSQLPQNAERRVTRPSRDSLRYEPANERDQPRRDDGQQAAYEPALGRLRFGHWARPLLNGRIRRREAQQSQRPDEPDPQRAVRNERLRLNPLRVAPRRNHEPCRRTSNRNRDESREQSCSACFRFEADQVSRQQVRSQQHADQRPAGKPEAAANVVALPSPERNECHERVGCFNELVLSITHFIGDDERRRDEHLKRYPSKPTAEVEADHLPDVLVHLCQRPDIDQHNRDCKQRDRQLERRHRRENRLHESPQRELGNVRV